MKVTILQQPKEVNVTTITLERDRLNPTNLNIMHCVKCGSKVLQFQGNIVRIIPGGLPQNILELATNIIARCYNCKSDYLINGIVERI